MRADITQPKQNLVVNESKVVFPDKKTFEQLNHSSLTDS